MVAVSGVNAADYLICLLFFTISRLPIPPSTSGLRESKGAPGKFVTAASNVGQVIMATRKERTARM